MADPEGYANLQYLCDHGEPSVGQSRPVCGWLGKAGIAGKIVVFNAPYEGYGRTVMDLIPKGELLQLLCVVALCRELVVDGWGDDEA